MNIATNFAAWPPYRLKLALTAAMLAVGGGFGLGVIMMIKGLTHGS